MQASANEEEESRNLSARCRLAPNCCFLTFRPFPPGVLFSCRQGRERRHGSGRLLSAWTSHSLTRHANESYNVHCIRFDDDPSTRIFLSMYGFTVHENFLLFERQLHFPLFIEIVVLKRWSIWKRRDKCGFYLAIFWSKWWPIRVWGLKSHTHTLGRLGRCTACTKCLKMFSIQKVLEDVFKHCYNVKCIFNPRHTY